MLVGEVVIRLLGVAPEMKSIELVAEDCVYQRSKNPVLGFELKANFRSDNPDFIGSYERTNAHGQRDEERTIAKKDGMRRVLLLGDSVVEGHGLAENETISKQWEELYSDGSTEVLNFGVSAYCTLAEIELLETKGLAFDPDIVVVLFVENDFDNFNREAFALGGTSQKPTPVKWLFRNSQFFRLASIRLNLFNIGADADPVRWNKDAIGDNNVVEGFKRLKKLKQLADRKGFKPLIAIWPRFLNDGIVNVPLVSESDLRPLAECLAALNGLPSTRLDSVFLSHQRQQEADDAANPRLYYTSGDGLHPSARGAAVAAAGLKKLVEELDAGKLAVPDVALDGSSKQALAVAQSLGDAEPDYSRVYHRQGVQLLKSGHFEKAIERFRLALNEDSNHAGAHGNMGLAFERMGKLQDAKRHYQRAIELRNGFAQAHFNLARLTLAEGETGETEIATQSLRRVIEIDPRHTDALNLLGMELGKAGNLAEAQSFLERAVIVDPNFSEAHNNLGTVFAATGQLGKALQEFKEAVRADPANKGALSRIERVKSMLREQQLEK
ncbi:MAG: Flp pilus assembly protein TadD [Verrucomicrobiales bacterium]|jgi:Flp pilus assembly protein TadD